jgi:hypothetical protein
MQSRAAPNVGKPRRGVHGSRRRRLADLPLRHVSAALGSATRGAARVRALLRRSCGDDLHVGSQTLPIWIYTNFARPRELPVVNVVALFVIIASIIPVWIAQRVAGGTGIAGDRPGQSPVAASIEAEP